MSNSNFNDPFEELTPNAIGPNQNFPPPGTPAGELTKPWPPTFNYNPNPPVIIPPGNSGTLAQEDVAQMVNCIKSSTARLQAATPNNNVSPHKRKVTADNIHLIQYVADYAADHPQTVNPTLDVAEWLTDLQEVGQIFGLEDAAETLQEAITDYKYALATVAFDDFRKYYQCIKILVADGLPDAVAIYPKMKEVYGNLYGRTGSRECPVAEINNAVSAANAVITKHKGLLTGILSNEKRLNANLSHEIHSADENAPASS